MSAAYVPDAGDFVWLVFDPQAGRERAGRRPALILSPRTYNARSGLAIVCPLTTQVKGYPFEVVWHGQQPGNRAMGAILSDHVESVEWKVREAVKLGRCPDEVMEEVRARLAPLLGY